MNPYKQSSLVTMPEVGQLIKSYTKASGAETVTSPTNENKQSSKKRRKRQEEGTPKRINKSQIDKANGNQIQERPPQHHNERPKRSNPSFASCQCNYSNPVSTTYSSTKFIYYPMLITWLCSFTCCANSSGGENGRPAWLTNNDLIQALVNANVIPSFSSQDDAWIGMHGTNTGNYYWNTDSATSTGQVVDVTTLCSNCTKNSDCARCNCTTNNWSAGGGIEVSARVGYVNFYNFPDICTSTTTWAVICECKCKCFIFQVKKILFS